MIPGHVFSIWAHSLWLLAAAQVVYCQVKTSFTGLQRSSIGRRCHINRQTLVASVCVKLGGLIWTHSHRVREKLGGAARSAVSPPSSVSSADRSGCTWEVNEVRWLQSPVISRLSSTCMGALCWLFSSPIITANFHRTRRSRALRWSSQGYVRAGLFSAQQRVGSPRSRVSNLSSYTVKELACN